MAALTFMCVYIPDQGLLPWPTPISRRRLWCLDMAYLSATWFIIETVLIPDGLQKWYCLSFFIHPLLLLPCQLFLWVEYLTVGLTILVFHPLKSIWYAILGAFRSLRDYVAGKLYLGGAEDFLVKRDVGRFEVLDTAGIVQSIVLHDSSRILLSTEDIGDNVHGFEEEEEEEEEEEDKEEESGRVVQSNVLHDCCKVVLTVEEIGGDKVDGFEEKEKGKGEPGITIDEDHKNDESSSGGCSSFDNESPAREREADEEREEVEIDEFCKKYIERMEWFDLLNYERTCGISAILNEQLGSSSLLRSREPKSLSFPYNRWSKMAKRKLLRSLESDFEMVYVGQSCLCWEALHHQYRKVEALASSASSIGGAFYDDVAGKFQQFRVLLERFLENERTEQKRCRNFAQARFSMKNLLQVPEISGRVEQDEGPRPHAVFARQVTKEIEKSIRTFWVFLKTDKKGSSWKLGSPFWEHSQVEDPKDLQKLAELTKALQKKELGMKNVLGKKRCWLKRTNPLEESQRLEVLFAMIEMKLVARVLTMKMISTHQLKWCQEKLNSIAFENDRVVRTCSSCLFPPS